jgi:hypothetical protein
MSEPRPFLEDGSQFGISRAGFEEMDEDEQREWIRAWFFQNFEDPNNQTPWDNETKSYMYLWGGPFHASDQLWQKFGDIVSGALIEEVVEEIQRDGTFDWAPTSNSPFYEHDDEEEPPEPPSLDIYLDEPSDRYGSPEECEARARAREAIDDLLRALGPPRPIGIGHNWPPDEEAQDAEEIKELRPALQELSAELAKPDPAIAVVKRCATPLRDALLATAKWALRKIDKGLDAAITAAAGGGVLWLAAQHSELLHKAFNSVVAWLDIAAKPFF